MTNYHKLVLILLFLTFFNASTYAQCFARTSDIQKAPFSTAENQCQTVFGSSWHFASIHSDAEELLVRAIYDPTPYPEFNDGALHVWIGYTGTQWTDGSCPDWINSVLVQPIDNPCTIYSGTSWNSANAFGCTWSRPVICRNHAVCPITCHVPTSAPTPAPTNNPTPAPTNNPTATPTPAPTTNPSKTPTISPTIVSLNPTKNPTLNPSSLPSITPTKNPSVSPSFHEGAVHVTGEGVYTSTGENEQFQSDNASKNDSTMILIIVGAIGGFVMCSMIAFGFCVWFKKQKKETILHKQNGVQTNAIATEGTVTTVPNSNIVMMKLGSISPCSMNSTDYNSMPFKTAGGAYEGDINDNDNEESDDGNNDLFGVTSATTGGGNEAHQLPDLPDNNDKNNEESEAQNDIDNELYKQKVTTGGRVDVELYENVHTVCKLCNECGKSVDLKDGKVDENDGNWYCHCCWNSFYE